VTGGASSLLPTADGGPGASRQSSSNQVSTQGYDKRSPGPTSACSARRSQSRISGAPG